MGDGFDGDENFIERIETAEIKFLASEIGHARAGGFERKHERAFEVILGAAQLFIGDGGFFQGAKFLDGEVDDLADGFLGGASVDGMHSSVRIRGQFAKNGVGQTLFFADVLEQARRHAPTEKIIEDSDTEALLVAKRNGGHADTEMNLFEVALGFELNGRTGLRSGIFSIA